MEKKKETGDGIPEVDVLMRGLLSQPGVEGFMVFNNAGIPLKWTPAFVRAGGPSAAATPVPASVVHHASVIGDLTAKARATAKRLLGDVDGEVQLLRLRTKTHEMLVAPHDECTLIVSQRAHSAVMTSLLAGDNAAAAGGAGGGAGAAGAAPAAEEKKGAP